MNAVSMNGPRTIVSRCLNHIGIGDRVFPLFVPSVPIGQPCVPVAQLIWSIAPWMSIEEAAEKAKLAHRELNESGIPHEHLQVLITEEYGCVRTVSASVALGMIGAVASEEVMQSVQGIVEDVIKTTALADGKGGEVAKFESLTKIHMCAPKDKRRSKGPGHWHRWRGKEMAKAAGGKGVWRNDRGEWMASHELALDYAGWLFPEFLIWTIRLIPDDLAMQMLEQCMGVRFVMVQPEKPASHLSLVHDAGKVDA